MPLRAPAAALLLALSLGLPQSVLPQERLTVRWEPASPRQGDVAVVFVTGVPRPQRVEGSLDEASLTFFANGESYAALAGIDLEQKPGTVRWRIGLIDGSGRGFEATGTLQVRQRKFPVQRLTLPREQVDLDPPTLRRAREESRRLRRIFATVTPERLWQDRFTKPVRVSDRGKGFGARRIINGQPRAPHTGVDYSADSGTAVVAANAGRVALVAEQFFAGRLVVLDHGLGLSTFYFHLERVDVQEGQLVARGQPIGAVGSTGRATGPHLHFGARLSQARIDPTSLLSLPLSD
ncbi:MAG: M23 family metallopeptidase [Candidatus Methylomirabilia bacterium]